MAMSSSGTSRPVTPASSTTQEEKLRELCCFGDSRGVKELLRRYKVDVNSENRVNGWTALHWAAKRGHSPIVTTLLSHGADPTLPNADEQLPIDLTSSQEIYTILHKHMAKSDPSFTHKQPRKVTSGRNTPALPSSQNYSIARQGSAPQTPVFVNRHAPGYDPTAEPPEFPRAFSPRTPELPVQAQVHPGSPSRFSNGSGQLGSPPPSLVKIVKVRVANWDDPDFVEVDLPPDKVNIQGLLEIACVELQIPFPVHVERVRRLPNTRIRRDVEVARLPDYSELEIVLVAGGGGGSQPAMNGGGGGSATSSSNCTSSISVHTNDDTHPVRTSADPHDSI